MSTTTSTVKHTPIDEISPKLASVLDLLPGVDSTDPSGADAFTSEWLIEETMRDDPALTREQAIALIKLAEHEALAGGL